MKLIKGTPELLRKTCNGPRDDEFVVAPSGHTICLEDFGMVPAGEQPSGLSMGQNRVKEASGRQPNHELNSMK